MKKLIEKAKKLGVFIRNIGKRRESFEVRYVRNRAVRGGNGWCLMHKGQVLAGPFERKQVAVKIAREICRKEYEGGALVELRICNLAGEYTKDGSTYGDDPRNIPG